MHSRRGQVDIAATRGCRGPRAEQCGVDHADDRIQWISRVGDHRGDGDDETRFRTDELAEGKQLALPFDAPVTVAACTGAVRERVDEVDPGSSAPGDIVFGVVLVAARQTTHENRVAFGGRIENARRECRIGGFLLRPEALQMVRDPVVATCHDQRDRGERDRDSSLTPHLDADRPSLKTSVRQRGADGSDDWRDDGGREQGTSERLDERRQIREAPIEFLLPTLGDGDGSCW